MNNLHPLPPGASRAQWGYGTEHDRDHNAAINIGNFEPVRLERPELTPVESVMHSPKPEAHPLQR